VLAVVAPGQGAQKSGFLTSWLTVRSFADRIDECSAAAGRNLAAAGTSLPDEAITDTAVAQPLIVAAGIGAATLLELPFGSVFAGHSVGELTAAAAAGVLDTQSAMRLVTIRGREMAHASADPEGGMAAVLGGDQVEVVTAITRVGCVPANYNGKGQIVAAGTRDAIASLVADPPAGARVRPLPVAGAFHSPLMSPARAAVASAAMDITTSDAADGVISNRDGRLVTSGADLLLRLVDQICKPVRWDLCMATLVELGVTAVIELPPAGTLTAMIRRAAPGIAAVALSSPNDIPAAQDLIAEHAAVPAGAR
jgi:[acyl-carrier-protein] S-malonyltransferase